MNCLSPSLLAADFARLGQQVALIDQAGAQYVHIDVMDGMFVPSISMGLPVIKSIRPVSDRIFDVHLMVQDPEKCGGGSGFDNRPRGGLPPLRPNHTDD